MIYKDFIAILNRSRALNSDNQFVDEASFEILLPQIDGYLNTYFEKKKKQRSLDILQMRAMGFTLDEIGQRYNLTRERIRQVINSTLVKLTNQKFIETNPELASLYSLLCGLGESDLAPFLSYLEQSKHVLSYIIGPKYRQAKRKNTNRHLKKREPLANRKEIEQALILFIKQRCGYKTLFDISTSFEKEWRKNKNLFSGNITWNQIMDTLLLLVEQEKIIKRNNTYVLNNE